MIRDSTISDLKERIDILEVAELYVKLKKAGSSFKGFSPFQSERTPSFLVSPSKGIWHDFSSGQGGDAIKLVMLLEGLTFPEAVEKLCSMYNIQVEYENSQKAEKISSTPLEIYKDWCVEQLHKNRNAIKYLHNRGLTDASIAKFEIGYSPNSNEIVNFIRSSTITENEAIITGIADLGDNGLYGRFVNRIMFPVRDHTGKLCGFSGRTLGTHPAKYVNTKETPLFHKSSLMYGFDKAKEAISKKGFFVLSEGQMDVIMEHQVGLKYAFASMGTALTEKHVKIIGRFAKKGIIAYDGDAAGINAAFKAAALFIRAMIDVRVVILGDDKDPADLISSGRAQEFAKLLKSGIPAIKFCIDRLISGYDLSNPFDKAKAFDSINNFANGMTSPLIRKAVLKEASMFVGTITYSSKQAIERNIKNYSAIETREKELIKAVLLSQNKEDIAMLVEIKKCFSLQDEIIALQNIEFDNPLLTKIFFDDNIVPSANLKLDITLFKIWCLKKFLHRIRHSSMSSEKKLIKMREAQMKIIELENQVKEL